MRVLGLVEVFISCAIHTEKTVLKELEQVLPLCLENDGNYFTGKYEILELIPGGIRLSVDLAIALQLNFWLRTAHRILVRLTQFKAGPWPELREKLKRIDLKSWIGDSSFELQVDAERCKTSNEKYLKKMCGELWKISESADQKIFLRGQNDQWTLSLDSTGEHLHRRGVRTKIGPAPLRETLAALTLKLFTAGTSRSALSKVTLVDPMAGSGTFLVEARDLFRPVTTRGFAFQTWKRAPALLKSESFWKNYPSELVQGQAFKRVVGSELDPKLKPVLQELQLPVKIGSFNSFSREDLEISSKDPVWLITNPPYGRRLENLDWIGEFWDWHKLIGVERAAVWIPRDLKEQFLKRAPLKPTREIRAINGGIACEILIF